MSGPPGRRQLLQLGGVIVAGWGAGQLLRRAAPVGDDVGPAAQAALAADGAPEEGPANATLRLAVFSDYRCPACRRGFPALTEALARDGGVRVVHRDWPIFGAASRQAAAVALAMAEQGLYPAVHRRLMTDARPINAAMLRDTVVRAGGDWVRANVWLARNAALVEARLAANARAAARIGLPGTPGYCAGRWLVAGAIDADAFARLFARARASG